MKVMHYIRNEIFMIIFSGMFLLCDMNANAQQIIKSSDTNDFRIGDSNDTYYIYDDLGLLRFVLSPSYQEEANLEKYGYEYRYDQRGRCVWKRLPGCEYLQLWYDNADNLMFSQDGEQRKKGIYVFYLYDFVKRQVLQGTTTAINSSCPSAIVAFNVSDAGICRSGYSSANDLGLKKEQLLQANYYDNHAFINGQLEKQATSQNLVSNQQASEQYSKGSLTGTVCMATDGKPLVSVYYHDLRGQVIASKQTLPDDALLSQNMTYSFTKQPLEIISEIFKNGISTTVTQTNSYNKHNDKIETMTLKVGNVTRTVSSYSYNDISRLLSIKRSGNVLRGYDFAYDGLNRLEESTYAEGAGMSQNKNRYSENILSYSPNGSIERLQRYGKKNNGTFGLIDDLMYSYNGNQIKEISDKAGSLLYDGSFDFKDGANADVEYFYDTNGALIKDLNKGISNIEYDVLGNLKCISFSNGFKTKYVYDAAGNKLRTTHESAVTNTTDYVGNFVFEDGKLDKYLFDGGYCSFDNSQNPTFHYYENDHLGSIRMVVNENGTIEQVNHYYPFGGVYGDLSYNAEIQKSKYIGKEFDHMHGLDLYDHGARMYDAAKVAWDRVDRHGEKYTQLSPYLYCGNNSLVNVDADGKRVKTIYFKDKEDPQWYRSSKSFYLAMMQFAQTDFGNQILSDFTPKGSYFFGVKGNGKYSKYDLEQQEIDITEPEKKTAYWRDINAQTQLLETDQGKPRFVVIFDVDRSTNELTKTIAHELAGHLYNYESVLKLYEDTKDFQKANFEFFKKGSKQEHLEMENKKYEKVNLYQQVMNQIEQFFKHK